MMSSSELEAVTRGLLCKKVFFLCKKVPKACNFIKKETLAQVFSCEFCEISKNTFLQKNSVAASAKKTAKNFFVDTGDI